MARIEAQADDHRGRPRLLGISKRGNVYLRTLLIHAAWAALPSLARSATPRGDWLRRLQARAHPNTVVVALANKLARIAWAVLQTQRGYEVRAAAVASPRDRPSPTTRRERLTTSAGGTRTMA